MCTQKETLSRKIDRLIEALNKNNELLTDILTLKRIKMEIENRGDK